eukprot:15124880-Alexandrium_andersonii.AAC.1
MRARVSVARDCVGTCEVPLPRRRVWGVGQVRFPNRTGHPGTSKDAQGHPGTSRDAQGHPGHLGTSRDI